MILLLSAAATAPTIAGKASTAAGLLAKEVRDKGWIVYGARSARGDWDLFLVRPDGSEARNITNTPNYSEAAPRFSPDGRRMLYRRLPKDDTINHDTWGFQGELVIAERDGTHPMVFGESGEYPWASWSPGAKQIACLTQKGIQIVDLTTRSVIRQMPRKGMYQQLFWSPDGKWFCGVANSFGEEWTVARMDSQTGEVNAVNTFQNCTPDWCPDSRRLVFSHRPSGQKGYGWTQLWIADGDGKNRMLVYGEDGRHIYGGALSPDGKYVLFTSGEKDGAGSEAGGAPMGLMRLADAPTIGDESKNLRKVHSQTRDGPVLTLPRGWEPHWADTNVGGHP